MTALRTVVDLPAPPRLSREYTRALTVAARRALPGTAGPTTPGRSGPATTPGLPHALYRTSGVHPDPAHLAAYQHLLGEPGTDELPAGFVHVLAFPLATALMSRPDFPLPLLGLVHVANTVTQHRPLRLGESLVLTAHAEGLRPHRAGTQVDLVTTASVGTSSSGTLSAGTSSAGTSSSGMSSSGTPSAGTSSSGTPSSGTSSPGEELWRGVSTYLAKGVRLAGSADDEPAREPFVAPLPTGLWSLGAETGRRYAAVSGDVNPIHLYAASARPFGFRRAIAHGMFTAARALADVGARRGGSFTWSVRFAAPVLLPARVHVHVAPDEGGWAFAGWTGTDRLHLTGRVDAA